MWGQYTFWTAFNMSPELKCFTIPDSYFDNQFLEESIVWSANRRISGNKTNTYLFLKDEYEKRFSNWW